MEIADVTVDSTDVDNDRQFLKPSIISKDDKLFPDQTVSKRIFQTDSLALSKRASQEASKKVSKPPVRQGKPAGDLPRKTSEARQKLLSAQNSQAHLEVPRAQTLKGNQENQRRQPSRLEQQTKHSGPPAVMRSAAKQSKKKKKKGCSCCGGNSPERYMDNDARHIAAINSSTQRRSSKCCGSSWCCCCCCRRQQPKRRSDHTQKGFSCSRCCKKFLAFLFSHVGLCSMVVAYSIMGGFLFRWLEATDEIEERIVISKKRNYSVSKVCVYFEVLFHI